MGLSESSIEAERRAIEFFGPLHLDQNRKAFLIGITILLRLDKPRPDFVVNWSRFKQPGGSVESRDPTFWQDPVGTKLRLAKVDRHLRAISKIFRGRTLTPLPQREM